MYYNFFDSEDRQAESRSIWVKYEKHMEEKPVFEGPLLKAAKNSDGSLDVRYFILQENYLVYKQNKESTSISSALRITFAQLKFPSAEELDAAKASGPARFAIKISARGKYSVLYAQNQEEFEMWKTHLSRAMMRVDFHATYQVNKMIGQGGFASVYEASFKSDPEKKFAVKGFNKATVQSQPREKQSLWNEITILRQLDHPNLLRLHEVHETENSIYIVFDLISGGELTQLLDPKCPVPESDLLAIFFGLARGLAHLADKGIVHRDLKPANILLKKKSGLSPDDVVVVDFGLATYADASEHIFKRCGTPGYIAPEIISSANPEHDFKVTTSCDVFGLGSIVYSLVHGCSPFHAPDRPVADVLRANLECQVAFGVSGFGRYAVDLVAVLSQMLRPDSKDRVTMIQVLECELFEKFTQLSPKRNSLTNSPHRRTYSLLYPYQLLPARGPRKISLEEYISPEMFVANTPQSSKKGSFPSPLQNTVTTAKSTVFRQSAYSSQKVSASKDKTEIGPIWEKTQPSYGKQEKERPYLALQSSPQQKNRLPRLHDARPEELNLPFLRGHRKTLSSVNK
jgi:calcium-dependent protein kinase